jgi:hypothetical protein
MIKVKNIVKMKTVYFYLSVLSTLFLCFSCTEKEIGPISGSSGKPEKVEILAVDSVPGGVTINYQIPKISDIIEIKAVYTLSTGQVRESSSSFYTSFITIDGYNDTDEHEALIYTINRAREMSEPVSVKFRPGESPLSKATRSMEILGDFGGIIFRWRNPDKRTLFFEFFTEDEKGEMVTKEIISSKLDTANTAYRGYDTIPYRFAVSISDNFGNSSGMLYPEGGYVTPLWEERLDKKIQKVLMLSGDVSWAYWGKNGLESLDDDINTNNHTGDFVMPGASLTLDLGKKAKLSRFVLHIVPSVGYGGGCLRIFEMYSSDDESDSPSGAWNTWTLRVNCTTIKPSGAPGSDAMEEDKLALLEGFEFSFPPEMPPVRYLRLKALQTWGGMPFAYFSEITTYGLYVE